MAGPQIVVEMDSDEAKLWAGFQRIMRGEEGMEKGMGKVAGETRKAAAEQAALERAAKRVIDSVMTPQERYNQKIAELNMLYGKSKLSVDQFRAALKQTESQYDRAEEAGDKAFGSGMVSHVNRLIGLLGVGTGLAGAIGVVKNEYQDMVEAQRMASQVSVTVSQAEVGALRNLLPKNEAERDEFLKSMQALSADTGVSLKDLYARSGGALSAKGDLPTQSALDAVKLSAQLVPENAGEGEAVAGATLDLMKLTGSKDPREALGLLMKVGQQSRIQNTGFLARNVAPALVTDLLRGDTPGEAGALYSTMTQAIVDPSGEKTRTAMTQLADQLAESLPDKGSTRARIEAIQQSKELQQKIIPDLKLESSARGPMEAFLKGQGQSMATYKEYLASAGTMQENAAMLDRQIGLIRGTPLQQTAQIDRAAQTTVETMAMADQDAARIGAIREQMPKLLQQSGEGWLGGHMRQMETTASGDELEDYLKTLKLQAYKMTHPRQIPRGFPGAGYMPPAVIEPTAVEMQKGQALYDLIRQIEQETQVQTPMSPESRRQINDVESGRSSNVPATPTAGGGRDPQMEEQTAVLKEISSKLNPPGRTPRPMPASSSTANTANRE